MAQACTGERRLRLRVRTDRKEDRISALPNSLLEHIISFIPTKVAIATSILSKRWKPIWRSQMNLDLDDKSFPDTFAFHQFFNSFITMRDNTLPILSFHLTSRHGIYSNHHLYDFVYPAVTRGVETLIIDLCHRNTLPSIVLTTKTLSVLKLKRIKLNNDFQSVDLPSLKVLHLEYVTFKGFAISNLVRATLYGKTYIGLEWLHNVEHLNMYAYRMPPTIHGVFHNLTHLELMFIFDDLGLYGTFQWSWLIKLLQNTPNLQTLIIYDLYKQSFLIQEEWEEPEIVPECLLSRLTKCSLTNNRLIHSQLPFAKYIMQNSRLLNTIRIRTAESLDTNTKLQMLIELSSCPRISPTSKLFFV
ncbi:F-box/FBD/LRR-repeat protein At4g00160 isoform X3 [Lathyrus oleraceus]|uniref:F-box/FBD/LRR-repeat protein At4g00160 isoform X3 n=1 Tax=Pisum sativum TaxID=3888 RepID=UPI0021D13C43|nr:F-box/FBD/LRR-repeat protein At4g00160-like isoform X3 [Pisum sativum]